jgi:hypothetical protein
MGVKCFSIDTPDESKLHNIVPIEKTQFYFFQKQKPYFCQIYAS